MEPSSATITSAESRAPASAALQHASVIEAVLNVGMTMERVSLFILSLGIQFILSDGRWVWRKRRIRTWCQESQFESSNRSGLESKPTTPHPDPLPEGEGDRAA